MAHNFQIWNKRIKLLTEYESVTQRLLLGNAAVAALMSGRKYDVISQNGVLWFFKTKPVIKTQRRYRTQYGRDPPSDNAIRCWLKQFTVNRNSYTANAGEHLGGNWIPLGHLTCHEMRACWNCLAFRSIDYRGNKKLFDLHFHILRSRRYRSWLKHYATSRKVAGSSLGWGGFLQLT
jgi:hypothetical protein